MSNGFCCCGCVNITVGARIVAGLSVAGSVYLVVKAAVSGDTTVMAIMIPVSIICLVLAVLVFQAVAKTKPKLLIPMFVVLVLNMLDDVLAFVVGMTALFWKDLSPHMLKTLLSRWPVEEVDLHAHDHDMQNEGAILAAASLTFLALHAWFYAIFLGCYRYLKEREKSTLAATEIAGATLLRKKEFYDAV